MEYKLKDIVTFKPGYAFKKSDMTDEGIDLVKIGNLKNNKVIVPSDVKIKEDIRFKDFIINKNDILMALTGDPVYKGSIQTWVGRTSKYLNDEIAYLNQRVCKLIPNERIIYGDYLYYWLIRYDKTYEIAGLFHGSANQANISHKEVGEMIINLPSLDIQRKVSKILSDVDKKINLNNQINNNLYELVRSYYIDLVNNSDKECSLSELMEYQGGSQPPASQFEYEKNEENIRFVQIRDFDSDSHICYIPNSSKNKLCSKKDILIARYGASLGRICYGLDGAYNVALAKVIPVKEEYREMLRVILESKDFYNYINQVGQRSAQAGFNAGDIAGYTIKIPEENAIIEFNKLADKVIDKRMLLKEENEKLSQLRDTLLPKLMNGEIDLDNIEI